MQNLANKLSQSTGQPDITQHFNTEEQIRVIGDKLVQVQVSLSQLHEPVIPLIIRWKHTLSELGKPITPPDISASLNDAIEKDVGALILCVSRTADQHRALREALRPILVLGSDASDAVQQKVRAFLKMEEIVRLREELMNTAEAFSVGWICILVILYQTHTYLAGCRESHPWWAILFIART